MNDAQRPLRVGLLSTARINDAILAGAAGSGEVDVVAVGSRDRARAEAYAAERGLARAHGSYEELLADDEVDAVYVSLPNGLHVDWSIRALEAGKHVLCEKPMDRRASEVGRAFDVAERTGLRLTEAFMWRHHPQTRRLRELLDEGAVGRVRTIRASFSFPMPHPGDVRLAPDLDGGALMDVGCYCVSGSRLAAGAEPVSVQGTQVLSDSGVDIRFAGVLRFPGDVLATFDCGMDLAARHDLEVAGDEGVLRLADPFHGRASGIDLRRGAETERIEVPFEDPYRLELEDLAAAVREDRPTLLGRDDALGQARTIEALYRAAGEGATVELA